MRKWSTMMLAPAAIPFMSICFSSFHISLSLYSYPTFLPFLVFLIGRVPLSIYNVPEYLRICLYIYTCIKPFVEYHRLFCSMYNFTISLILLLHQYSSRSAPTESDIDSDSQLGLKGPSARICAQRDRSTQPVILLIKVPSFFFDSFGNFFFLLFLIIIFV